MNTKKLTRDAQLYLGEVNSDADGFADAMAHALSSSKGGSKNSELEQLVRTGRRFGTRSILATQAIMRFNSGKRVRFIGSSHWAHTGGPVKPKPRKFLPAQVLRRQASK